jgi:GTP cyclohydrolase FolE2
MTDRKENNNLRKQVETDRDIIKSLDEKVKFLEDTVRSIDMDLKAVQHQSRTRAPPVKPSSGNATGTTG